jgi:hypothetical protein
VEGENVPALRRGIKLVSELRFDAGAFVGEWKRLAPLRVNIQQAFTVLAGLLFDAS